MQRRRRAPPSRLQRRRAREGAQCFSPFTHVWIHHLDKSLPPRFRLNFSLNSYSLLLLLLTQPAPPPPPSREELVEPRESAGSRRQHGLQKLQNASRLKPTQTQNEQTSGWTTDLHNLVPSHFCASILKQLGLMLLQVDEAVGFRSVR